LRNASSVFGTPEEALEFPLRFLSYAMTYASDEDIEILKKHFSDDESKLRWMTPHLGFSTKAPGQNGINATPVPHSAASEATHSRRRPSHSS